MYFHNFEITLQFLFCGSCICSSLLWSVGNSSVLREYQQSKGAHLGVRIVPSLEPTLFSCCYCQLMRWVSYASLDTAPVENTAGIVKPSTFFTAWPFTIISHFSLPLKCGLLLFIGTFWKEKTQFNQNVVLRVFTVAPPFYHSVEFNLSFSIFFLVWSLESCLKVRALVSLLKNSAGKGMLLGYGIRW